MPPVASTLQTPTQYANELLALCNAALADTVGGTIDRVYLSPGRPSLDCEQLTVSEMTLGDTPFATTSSVGGGKRHITGATNLVGYLVTVVRDCVPVMDDEDFPDPDDISAAAVEVQEDVWAIWTRIRQEQFDGELFGGKCDHLYYDGAVALETEGSFAGWEIQFRAEIDGILGSGS